MLEKQYNAPLFLGKYTFSEQQAQLDGRICYSYAKTFFIRNMNSNIAERNCYLMSNIFCNLFDFKYSEFVVQNLQSFTLANLVSKKKETNKQQKY